MTKHSLQTLPMIAGRPFPLGASATDAGVNFAVFSQHAVQIEVCLFDPHSGAEVVRMPLPERTGAVWHGMIEGLGPGALYGLRAHGPFQPEAGHRFNANKLLLDPYARAFDSEFNLTDAVFGYDRTAPNADMSFDPRDSAPFMPKCIVVPSETMPPENDPANRRRPDRVWSDTLIYEVHVRGATRLHEGVDTAMRGTFEGLASPPMLDHLNRLGVTAIELLPVQAFVDDSFLLARGLKNYWGYNTIGFFAPAARYLGPAGRRGFRDMVSRFHTAGIEVILDVVYNHTAESDQLGPTLSFRGLDNASYYRLHAEDPRSYENFSGCGNTFNLAEPFGLRLVMDSLRYWAEDMNVDGFRFDLATALAREADSYDMHCGFFDALRQDPVLASRKLIAEPWDLGRDGYRLGQFPPEFGEWNDRFRDSVRRFWRRDADSAKDFAARLLGSADYFDRGGRRPQSSINFVAAHDGFTLADLTSFNERRNTANGEAGADGHHANFSDNCGAEGPTDIPAVLSSRALRQRNLLATLFLSQGIPMLLAGDEFGRTQFGNNNAYCQDNEVSWIDWRNRDQTLLDFVFALSAFRARHPVLRQSLFLHGRTRSLDDLPDVEWRDFHGAPVDWSDPGLAQFCLIVRACADAPMHDRTTDQVAIAINRRETAELLHLPLLSGASRWRREIDTASPLADIFDLESSKILVQPQSVVACSLGFSET